MTSKRALVELIIEAGSVNANEKRISFLSNEIEKDLEVLEILKQKTILYEDKTQGSGYINSNGDFHYETYTYYFLNGRETDKETYFKLKEWLENE